MRPGLRRILIALLAAWLVTLAGCQLIGVAVPFETIGEATEYTGAMGYPDGEPLAILLTTRDDIRQIEEFVSQSTLEQLEALDFQLHVAVALFRGLKGSTGYQTIIERIVLLDNRATVYAQFWDEGKGGYPVGAASTSPYHLVKVRRDSGFNQDTTLILKSRPVVPLPPQLR